MKLPWLPGLLLLCLLVGCRSQQIAFRFSPARVVAVETSSPVAVVSDEPGSEGKRPADDSRRALPVLPAQAAPATSGGGLRRAAARPRLRKAAAKTLALITRLPAVGRKPAPAAAQTASARAGGLERGALLVGLGSLVLGLVLRLVAATSFVTLIQVLLYLAAFALSVWFVLLLLRASQER